MSIAGRHLSKSEDDVVSQIESLANALCKYAEEFGLTVEMFNENRPHSFGHDDRAFKCFRRSCICAQAAAVTLFNFQEALDALNGQIRASPFVVTHADDGALRAALVTFRKLRQAAKARHAVSHSAEEVQSPERMKKSNLKEENENIPVFVEKGAEIFVGLSLSGSVLTMPYRGRYLSVEVSEATRRLLLDTCDLMLGALKPVEEASERCLEAYYESLRLSRQK